MKKSSKIIIAVIAALIALTAVLAVIHSAARTEVPDGALLVSCGEKKYVDLNSFNAVPVQGSVINGKGEKSYINTQGVPLADVIENAGFDPNGAVTVKVTADDEFSAELSGDELNEEGKAYLVGENDGSVRLVVFGDSNAKRNVRNVVSVEISLK